MERDSKLSRQSFVCEIILKVFSTNQCNYMQYLQIYNIYLYIHYFSMIKVILITGRHCLERLPVESDLFSSNLEIKASFSVCCMTFLKFYWNKPHNIKVLIILSHSWSPFFLLTYLYEENELLWGSVCPFGVFSQHKKLLHFQENSFVMRALLQNYPCLI